MTSGLLLAVSQVGLCQASGAAALLLFSFAGGVSNAFIWVNHVPFLSDNAHTSRRAEALVIWSALQVVIRMLLSLAEAGLFRPRWSSRILDETQKAITQITKGETDGSRQRAAIEAAFPEALVTGYEIFEGKLALPDPGEKNQQNRP